MPSVRDEAVLNAIFNPLLPVSTKQTEDVIVQDKSDSYKENEEVTKVKQLELEGVHAAEKGDLDAALDAFNRALQVMPERASCYNNRAQAFRLKGDIKGALEDLDKAILLSEGEGKAGRQAYVQRGLIRRLQGQNESALDDFQKAADLGSEFAKGQVVQLNPYAAMCNQMLTDVFQQLKTGHNPDE
ncbi:tetratricopeptide repeat protein 36-like isoform X1 [Anneissia japonica]|uniref:tetratricopeptide repeat protein 36-like isoform X1 n=1 Tax=Anneissia japonica TaxID=1529436 RepID=UPI0014256176|nr:tetratricopeptide repeat protein 36-like isoform X1 [Anneissia japonica]